jgi:dolichol-phosphate mannosyltransferase
MLSIVAPCYNEEQGLSEFVRRATAAAKGLGIAYELVLVNDGSRDGTWRQMQELAAADPHIVAVNLSRNHGHQLALSAGLSVCLGERILIIDADLQDPPELAGEMMQRMDAGADVVYGQRRKRAGETVFKLATAAAFYRLIERLTDTPIPRDTGDFRLMSRRALDVLMSMPERHRFIRGMVSWIGFKQEALQYDRDARFAGETKYPFRKMLKFAIDAVTAFSIKPLTFAVSLGFGAAIIAVGLVIYSVLIWLSGKTVPGWTSIVAALAFFSAVQLIVLGIFGEYLGRLYEQAKGRPLFIIADIVRETDVSERSTSVEPRTRAAALHEAKHG